MRTRVKLAAWLATVVLTPITGVAQSAVTQPGAKPADLPVAERVVISPITEGAYVGTSMPLTARVWMKGQSEPAANARVIWSSSNSTVAWVTDSGTVQFVREGKTVIKARVGTAAAEHAFEVKENPARSISLADIAAEVRVGQPIKLAATVLGKGDTPVTDVRVNYAIVAPRGRGPAPRASVSSSGVFVAQDPGVFTVIAEIAGFADRAQIRVRPAEGTTVATTKRVPGSADEKVKFPDVDYTPYVGTSFPIMPLIHRKGQEPVLDTNVSWQLDNNDVASVSPDGMITFLKPGKVTVTADDGVLQLTKKFTVQHNPSAKMVMVVNAGDVRVGDSVKVNVQIWARGGLPVKDARPNFAIMSEGVRTQKATITEEGRFVAEEPGVYTIIAEIGGLADKTTIAVRARDK